LINNRQGGRRRGRGGPRGPNLGGQPGNRQDNRQRGNAAQLLEKYKALARDAQLAGDRVQTEYYLQYADHYFRILGESRARFEDQRPRRGDESDDDADNSSSDNEHGFQHGDEEMAEAADGEGSGNDEPRGRPQRPDRDERFNRGERSGGQRSRYSRDDRPSDDGDEESDSRVNGGDDSLPLDVLPPAIGADSAPGLAAEEPQAPAPRRRTRAARPAKDDDEVAPAV
jgi:hypothetical protein